MVAEGDESVVGRRSMDFPDDFKPLLADDVILYEVEGRLVVFSPGMSQVSLLSETASFILSCCNGKHSIQDIALGLVSNYHVDEKTARMDVRSVIRKLSVCQVVSSSFSESEVAS